MTIHPNAPPRLVRDYRKVRSFHTLADNLEINVMYVHKLITQGIEPNDTTPQLREVRKKLYLTRYRRKDKPRKPPTPTQKAIRGMVKKTAWAIRQVKDKTP